MSGDVHVRFCERLGVQFPRATHLVLGFQVKSDAERFWVELAERFRKFRLDLHPEKTRLLEFGPYAADNRHRRGEGKPETFNFLGFTHICGKKRSNGRFTVLRQTIRKRLPAKLSAVKAELTRRMHDPIPAVGSWLRSVVGGHIRYYGVPMNTHALPVFSVPGGPPLASHGCRGVARTAACSGTGCGGSSTDGCLLLASVIRILCVGLASSPEARAGCGKPARPDPWRGSWATMIPTPTAEM